jgi:hypothetical protein
MFDPDAHMPLTNRGWSTSVRVYGSVSKLTLPRSR